MSHLGLSSAIAATKYFDNILCVDENENKIDQIKKFKLDYGEPDLKKKLKSSFKKITFTTNFTNLKNTEIIYLSSDTKTNASNKSDLSEVKRLLNKFFLSTAKLAPLVILSQIPPGFTKNISKNRSDSIYYQVETLVLGKAIERASNPERIIIGCKTKNQKIHKKLKFFLDQFRCEIIKTNYVTAELIKIAINLYLISSVSLTNSLANISKKIGADWSDIQQSLRKDKRIGKHAYLTPGIGIAGGNLERDLENILELINKNKIDRIHKKFFLNFKDLSKHMSLWIDRRIKDILKQKKIKNIGIFGLSYKENTNSTKNAKALNIIRKYSKKYKIFSYDPLVKIKSKKKFLSIKKQNFSY